ncbi:hypothetical protein CDV31_013810 [Fusarium ambrosium]|uniref:Uncharacterized protein n=1 Tax=Fusarium ambrosium TaxID=131363 RepID=A0A428T0T9_9HYPO|nr:hypothetical protein CDV31_013810 [Fusarium ambrosium]
MIAVSKNVADAAGEACDFHSTGRDLGKNDDGVEVSRGSDVTGTVIDISPKSEDIAAAIKVESLENATLEMAPPSGATNVSTWIQLSLCQIIIFPSSDPDASSFSSAETAKALTGLRCP